MSWNSTFTVTIRRNSPTSKNPGNRSNKQRLHKYSHGDDHTTRELIYEGWTHVSQRREDDRCLIVVVAIVVIAVNQLDSWSIYGRCEIITGKYLYVLYSSSPEVS